MTATLAPERTYSTPEAARLLGVTYKTVSRCCNAWTTPVGPGGRYRVSHVDLLVLRAWSQLPNAGYAYDTQPAAATHLRRLAETTIRFGPRRWLLIGQRTARTFHEAEEAAAAWLEATEPAWLIDLEPWA